MPAREGTGQKFRPAAELDEHTLTHHIIENLHAGFVFHDMITPQLRPSKADRTRRWVRAGATPRDIEDAP